MKNGDRFCAFPQVLRLACVVAIVGLWAMPTPSLATPASASDLGVASGMKILDGISCGQYMSTQALVNQCDSANANHYIILGWNFNPNACSAAPCSKPDGFNIMRSTPGSAASVFTTLVAGPGQTNVFGTILQGTKGDENIGACFSVAPYRGTSDIGRPSNAVCIDETAHLAPTRWGTAHSHYYYSSQCSSPTSNPAGYGLMFMNKGANSGTGIFAGYVERFGACVLTVSNSFYDDFYQGLVYYDLSKYAGQQIVKATLKLEVVAGAHNVGTNRGTLAVSNGNEQRVAMNCTTNVGFPNDVNVGSDPTFPQSGSVASVTFATVNSSAGAVDVDITGMVRAWLNPGGINRGIVLSPAYLTRGQYSSAEGYNAECLSQYREPVLDLTFR